MNFKLFEGLRILIKFPEEEEAKNIEMVVLTILSYYEVKIVNVEEIESGYEDDKEIIIIGYHKNIICENYCKICKNYSDIISLASRVSKSLKYEQVVDYIWILACIKSNSRLDYKKYTLNVNCSK